MNFFCCLAASPAVCPRLAQLGLAVTPSSLGLLSDKMQLSREMVLFFILFPPFEPRLSVSVAEHIIAVGFGFFWWCLICVCQLRPWLTSSALDQTRSYYQPGLGDGLCQLLLSLGQCALERMHLE